MAAFTIPTIFSVIDKMSGPLTAMGAKVSAFALKADISLKSLGSKSDKAFSALTGGMGGYAAAAGIGLATLAIHSFVTEASKIEDTTAYFTPVLGSVEKAKKLVQMLNKEAASTPFEFEHISGVASTLLPLMNGNLEATVKTFRMLGDVSGGSVDKLQRVTLGYSKSLLKGKVSLESLNIIAEAGVPIFGQMAKTMYGNEKATGKLFEAISKGQVPLSALTKTMEAMTSKGGMFFEGMIISSKTFTGVVSSMQDSFKMAAAEIGDAFLPILKEYAIMATQVADKAKAWAMANKNIIKSGIKDVIEKVATVVKFLTDNIDGVIVALKVYMGLLLFIKTISFAVAIYEAITAVIAFTVSIWSGVVAMWALLWPILAVIAVLALMLLPFYLIYKAVEMVIQKWDEWGASIALIATIAAAFFSPVIAAFGVVILLVKSFYDNWGMITKAFKEGGILAGFKAIGVTILDAILMPLQQVLKIISNLTGFDWAADAAKSIEAFRKDLGVNVDHTSEDGAASPAINTKAIEQDALIQRMESKQTNNARVDLNINDPNQRVNAKANDPFGLIKLTSTHAY